MKNSFVMPMLAMLIVFSATASAADVAPVPTAPVHEAISVVDKGIKKTVEMKFFKMTLKEGDSIGESGQGIFCTGVRKLTYVPSLYSYFKSATGKNAKNALAKAGYKEYQESESSFETKTNNGADFQLAANMKAYQQGICSTGKEASGGVYVKIFWELFSAREQKVVYSKVTEGSVQNTERVLFVDMMDQAITRSMNNLLAENEFVTAMQDANATETATPQASSYDPLKLPAIAPLAGGVTKNITQLLKAVVTIENNGGSGTGFYISKDGYILTANHVVKGAKYVRIRVGSFDFFPGEVVRSDALRDIALIKTQGIDFPPLSLRATPAVVAEEVYAIGSPLGKNLAGTVAKGILSADRTFENKTYLQSDVSVTNGSSGGPLFDAKGAVIGLTQSGIPNSGNLNFFIPIADGLKKLSIEVR